MLIRTLPQYSTDSHNASVAFIVEEDFIVKLHGKELFTVPKGTISDGASVPKILHGFISPVGIIGASICHDFCYRAGSSYTGNRKDADTFFRAYLKQHYRGKPGPLGRFCIYWALRCFGSAAWKCTDTAMWAQRIAYSESKKEEWNE